MWTNLRSYTLCYMILKLKSYKHCAEATKQFTQSDKTIIEKKEIGIIARFCCLQNNIVNFQQYFCYVVIYNKCRTYHTFCTEQYSALLSAVLDSTESSQIRLLTVMYCTVYCTLYSVLYSVQCTVPVNTVIVLAKRYIENQS